MNFDSAASLRLISESLGLMDRLGARPIAVRDVRMSDRTLVVEFEAQSTDPAAVKAEIAGVMGALSGLDVGGLFPELEAQSLGVRALDPEGEELLWIVSSFEAAGFAAKGQPVEWLARSLIQENTPSYRRSQADRRIGQIETALRDLINHHGARHSGAEYANELWTESAVRRIRDRARAEAGTEHSRDLLDYAYLPQLTDAVARHVAWFDDGCIPDGAAFKHDMARLNQVRRKIAHHRPVSEKDLRMCQDVSRAVLGPVGRVHPEIARDFLVDRWEDQVAEVMAELQRTFPSAPVPDRGVVSESERRRLAVVPLKTQLSSVESACNALDRLVIPVQRSQLQRALMAAVVRWRDSLRELVTVAERPNLSTSEAEAAHTAYRAALREVRDLRQEIQALRQGVATGSE